MLCHCLYLNITKNILELFCTLTLTDILLMPNTNKSNISFECYCYSNIVNIFIILLVANKKDIMRHSVISDIICLLKNFVVNDQE